VVDLILPQECLGCGRSGTWLCRGCLGSIRLRHDFACAACHRPSWQGETHEACGKTTALDGQIIAAWRGPLLKDLIHSLKYENLTEAAGPLAGLLRRKTDGTPLFNALLLGESTALVPVPLHQRKEWDRGYNQSRLLAKELAQDMGIEILDQAIKRTRNTKTQTELPRHKRLTNLKNAFEATEPEIIKGRNLVIVDDVLTTGATAGELAKVLKQAGAKEVWALALMRG